jgi:hypothetical protein
VRRAPDGEFIAAQETDQLDVEPGFRYEIRRATENPDVALHVCHKKMKPMASDKSRQFRYLTEHVITQLLWENDLAPFLFLGTNNFVRICKDEHGDNSQLFSALIEVPDCREMALVGRVERSRKEEDLISPTISESRLSSGDDFWCGGVAARAGGLVEDAYRSSGTAQGFLKVGLYYIWTACNVLINKRCQI